MNEEWKPKCFTHQFEDREFCKTCRACPFSEDCELFMIERKAKYWDEGRG